ncbi:hypothetical protein FQA47_005229 [Oryzias melastigma]|uniref:Uncharacterized protein n=1 Tax=Oryzias melastigma TaxID=30732 RepID=A0A834CB81_ORYME|nr:hypothetical protein FQA47_005229 [Oryzias melastigma]
MRLRSACVCVPHASGVPVHLLSMFLQCCFHILSEKQEMLESGQTVLRRQPRCHLHGGRSSRRRSRALRYFIIPETPQRLQRLTPTRRHFTPSLWKPGEEQIHSDLLSDQLQRRHSFNAAAFSSFMAEHQKVVTSNRARGAASRLQEPNPSKSRATNM